MSKPIELKITWWWFAYVLNIFKKLQHIKKIVLLFHVFQVNWMIKKIRKKITERPTFTRIHLLDEFFFYSSWCDNIYKLPRFFFFCYYYYCRILRRLSYFLSVCVHFEYTGFRKQLWICVKFFYSLSHFALIIIIFSHVWLVACFVIYARALGLAFGWSLWIGIQRM